MLQDWQDDDYYQSYGKLGLQLEMLADKPRTLTYLKAIKSNRSYLKDKVILDVGCGTGILSLFCVKYGHARKVYAVEASDSALFAKNIIAENGFTDKIFVINNKIEELSDAIKEEVDLIISEWMGTLLISEFMIESVICARNLYLKADGKMFPSAASLHIVPYSAKSAYNDNLLFWDDVYGFKFKSVKQHATEEIFGKPMHNFIAQTDNFLAKPQKVTNLNMASITPADLEHIESDCSFTMSKSGQVHGFCTWFSVEFESLCSESTAVILNTGPNSPLTHWKHPLLMLDSPLNVKIGDEIRIKFIMTRNVEMRRHLIIKIIGIFQDNLTQNKSLSFSKEYFCWQ